jgi:hypothetical protein
MVAVVVKPGDGRLKYFVCLMTFRQGAVICILLYAGVRRTSKGIPVCAVIKIFAESTLGVALRRCSWPKVVWCPQVFVLGYRTIPRSLAIVRMKVLVCGLSFRRIAVVI